MRVDPDLTLNAPRAALPGAVAWARMVGARPAACRCHRWSARALPVVRRPLDRWGMRRYRRAPRHQLVAGPVAHGSRRARRSRGLPLRVLLGDDPAGHFGHPGASRSPAHASPSPRTRSSSSSAPACSSSGSAGAVRRVRSVDTSGSCSRSSPSPSVRSFSAWSQLDANERGRWAGRSRRGRALAIARPVVGVVLATVGVVALATQGQGFDVVLTSALAAVAVLVGAAVIALPWVVRMWQGLQAEQTERIRATERADIAAHLHDSVLQTLALVQRRADDPATVIRLARAQERAARAGLRGPEPVHRQPRLSGHQRYPRGRGRARHPDRGRRDRRPADGRRRPGAGQGHP